MKTPINDGGPAFPRRMVLFSNDLTADGGATGMSRRTFIATAAMQGLLADHKDHSDECADGETCPQTTARLAVAHADALIAELAKEPKE